MALLSSIFLPKFPSSTVHQPSFSLMMKTKVTRITCMESEPKFFHRFIDKVLKNLYLPTHSELVKYNGWKRVTQLALCDLHISYQEKLDGDFVFFILRTKDEHMKLLEKRYSYMLNGEELESMKYFDIIQLKKEEMEEDQAPMVELYEKARCLKSSIKRIRALYKGNMKTKYPLKKQLSVATYLVDIFGFGSEKDDEASNIGCCSLKVGDVEFIPPNKLKYLGKDAVKYANIIDVEAYLYRTIQGFQAGKNQTDYLFHEINTSMLNDHLKGFMPGLTAKVFRTYNASITLDAMLSQETIGNINQKVEAYEKAIKEVAIICNHQRTVSKSHDAQNKTFVAKIKQLRKGLEELRTNLNRAKEGKPPLAGSDGKKSRNLDAKAWEKKIAQQNAKIKKMEQLRDEKDDVKTVVLGTSKICYMDPRITVAWCKRHQVPIEKIFNESRLAKFAWARDAEPDFRF